MKINKKIQDYPDVNEIFLQELSKSKKARRQYLQVAIEDFENEKNLPCFLLALRTIAQASGGIGELSKKMDVNRQTLYKALSNKGNPSFVLINKIINNFDMKIAVK